MKKTVLCRGFVFVAAFCLLFSAAGAEVGNLTPYEVIDEAFMTKSPDNVRSLLQEQRDTPEYPELEAYVLKKSRGLLISNQLELIQEMTLAIIDNNLDCQDAVSLYTLVERAIEKRDASLEAEKAQAAKDSAYVASVSDEQKEQAKKQYASVGNENTGESVYVNTVGSKFYSPITWNAGVFAALGYITDDFDEIKIGVGGSGNIIYRADLFSLGLSLFAENLVITSTKTKTTDATIDLVPSVSYVPLNEDLFLRTGVTLQMNQDKPFISPVVGVGGHHVFSEINTANWYIDYYPAHLAPASAFSFAAGAGANVNLGLARVGSNVFYLSLGLRENIHVTKSGDVKNRTRVNLGLGVGCND